MKPMISHSRHPNILSDQIALFAVDDPSAIPAWIDVKDDSIPELFRKYEYPVSSWPVLIQPDAAKKLNELCVRIPKLIAQIPNLYFQNDIARLADFYFGGDQMLTQFALVHHNKKVEIPCRLDLTHTAQGFKILEANMGSSIGGWQIHCFETAIRKTHTPLTQSNSATNFQSRNTQLLYMEFLVDRILEQVPNIDREINLFLTLGEAEDESVKEASVQFIDSLFQQELKKRGLSGGTYFGKLSSLKLIRKKLTLGDKTIHCPLILGFKSDELTPDIFRAFVLDSIYLPDHLGISILGDKRNLGLLRILASEGKFAAEDNQLILDGIPWTMAVEDRTVFFEEQEHSLLHLLRMEREKFVIKDANGFQGKDVFIGKFTSAEQWETVIETALTNGGFIAQQFSESMNYFAPNKNGEWTPHKLIWGAFCFGKNYGGVWVRMSEVATDVGVINSATGAVEAIVFETQFSTL